MKHYTDAEVLTFLKETWPDTDTVELNKNRTDLVSFTLSSMYDPPGLNFNKLCALSEFFDTRNMTDPDTFSKGGCETCDYGSSYGFTIELRPNAPRTP